MNKIYIVGEINEESYKKFSEELTNFELDDPGSRVTIELNSEGGTALDALAIAGRIRASRIKIECQVFGSAKSAAVIILAACDYRIMSPEAWVMVHEDSGKVKGSLESMEKEVKQLRVMEYQWSFLLQELTKKDANFWAALHKDETYLTAKECLEYGLVDSILVQKARGKNE